MPHRHSYASFLALLALLVTAWLFWSGIYKPILLWLGVVSCALSLFLAQRIGFFRERSGFHLVPRLFRYWIWLLGEICKSSYEVTKIVLSPRLPISPTLTRIEAQPKGPFGQVILSNSITLSPGTVTLDLDDGQLLVHCLTGSGGDSVAEANRITASLTEK